MSDTATFPETIRTRISSITEEIVNLKVQATALSKTLEDDTEDTEKKHELQVAQEKLKLYHKELNVLYTLLVASPNTSNQLFNEPQKTVKIKAPAPYKIGDDFTIFYELFRSFTAQEDYESTVQILKTLLTTEAYKICRHVFEEADNFRALEAELNSIFAKTTNLTSAIHNFRQIKQLREEKTEAFATRVRLCAAEAFPKFNQIDREPYMVQMFVQGLNVSAQQKNLLSVTEHKSLSEVLMVAARMNEETTEIHSVESNFKSSKFCKYCKKPGHLLSECRTRPARNFNASHSSTSAITATNALSNSVRNSTPICYNCQKPGHTVRYCKAPVHCQLCDRPGHVARQCRTVKFTIVKTNAEPSYGVSSSTHIPTNPFQGNE